MAGQPPPRRQSPCPRAGETHTRLDLQRLAFAHGPEFRVRPGRVQDPHGGFVPIAGDGCFGCVGVARGVRTRQHRPALSFRAGQDRHGEHLRDLRPLLEPLVAGLPQHLQVVPDLVSRQRHVPIRDLVRAQESSAIASLRSVVTEKAISYVGQKEPIGTSRIGAMEVMDTDSQSGLCRWSGRGPLSAGPSVIPASPAVQALVIRKPSRSAADRTRRW